MVDTACGELGNKGNPGVGNKAGEDNSRFVDEDRLQKDRKRCERCSQEEGWKQGGTRSAQWDF